MLRTDHRLSHRTHREHHNAKPKNAATSPPRNRRNERTAAERRDRQQRANVPPLDSAKNDAKTGNGRQKHEKDRNKAMPISLSYAYFTLNNSHFSLFKKERGCERPAGAKRAPGASLSLPSLRKSKRLLQNCMHDCGAAAGKPGKRKATGNEQQQGKNPPTGQVRSGQVCRGTARAA